MKFIEHNLVLSRFIVSQYEGCKIKLGLCYLLTVCRSRYSDMTLFTMLILYVDVKTLVTF